MRRRLGLAACAVLAQCGTARAQLHDPATYDQPRARCVRHVPGRILTRVGRFPGGDGTPLEVVTTVTLRPAYDDALIDFGAPSISVFDGRCRLLWRQAFDPFMGEIGFQTLTLPGGAKALYVVAVSMLFPADQTVSQEALLVARRGRLLPFGPDNLVGSRFYSTYVGTLPDSTFAVVTEQHYWSNVEPQAVDPPLAHVFRYKPSEQTGHVGTWMPPETLDLGHARALHLPESPPHPAFPFCRFFYGSGPYTCVPSPMVITGSDPSTGDRGHR